MVSLAHAPTHFPKWEVSIGSCLALYRHCSKESVNKFGTLNETGDYNDIHH